MPPLPRRATARRAVPVLLLVVAGALLALLQVAAPSGAVTKADHSGWPPINGALIINRQNQSRPIDMRAGHDPFDHTDTTYSCDGAHQNNACFVKIGACQARGRLCAAPPIIPANLTTHNELLGGHGNDTIYAGSAGDVIWGDDNYPANPATQSDKLFGGPGPDFIYASHGTNEIHTGGGHDAVFARVGRGRIYCDSADTIVDLSRRTRKLYKLYGCKRITLKPVGTKQYPG